ncbi:hypothetical protein HNQ43_000697 [Faecalicoccus acidiformans]|uniref:Uncharacterized protein n=1 Tax=Faecalicoccus acidiformans TaxID=915173 RepID=A0A7W8D013_9FIRM|nr:hypothetical protein [Faecalicoccus acidiformans]MBB5184656.1 hypothetical protein [Faecalicoccus acidiformans]
MKKNYQEFARGIQDALIEKGYGDLFSLEELESFCLRLFRSIVNKAAVLIGIVIVTVFFGIKGSLPSWFFSTAIIFWLAWLVSTSETAKIVQEFKKRKNSSSSLK